MKIEILKQTSIAGVPAYVGDVVEVSAADGRYLLNIGKAIEAPVVESPIVEAPAKRKPRTKVNPNGDLSTNP